MHEKNPQQPSGSGDRNLQKVYFLYTIEKCLSRKTEEKAGQGFIILFPMPAVATMGGEIGFDRGRAAMIGNHS
jgi:hypothetical protein